MTGAGSRSVHASAVRIGNRAVLIRGPSGAGKSRLAFDLIMAGRSGLISQALLVGDDRVHLEASNGALVVRAARELAGLIEIRGLGIRHCDFTEQAIVGLVVDLAADDAERLPPPEALRTAIAGVEIPRIPVASGHTAFPLVVAALMTTETSSLAAGPADCSKGIGNHMRPSIATE